jgi:hypothetical protein
MKLITNILIFVNQMIKNIFKSFTFDGIFRYTFHLMATYLSNSTIPSTIHGLNIFTNITHRYI